MIEVRQCDAGHLSLDAANWECPWCEVERLRTEMHDCSDRDTRAFASLQAQAHRHEAEVERLREALVLVTYGLEYGSNGERDYVRGIARAALRGGGERCLCDDDSPNHCAKCTRELLRGGGE